MLAMEPSYDAQLAWATWILAGATVVLALATIALFSVGCATAWYAYCAFEQAKKTDEFTRRSRFAGEFFDVLGERLGGTNKSGRLEAEALASQWSPAYECIRFVHDVVVPAHKRETDQRTKDDLHRVANQIVRDALADWVAGTKHLTQGRTLMAQQMSEELESKMRLGVIASTEAHSTFTLP